MTYQKRPLEDLLEQLELASAQGLILDYTHCPPHVFFTFIEATPKTARLRMIIHIHENFNNILIARLIHNNESFIIQYSMEK